MIWGNKEKTGLEWGKTVEYELYPQYYVFEEKQKIRNVIGI